MRQLSRHDAGFLDADTIHANANVTFVQIYDQSTVPGGMLRLKTLLAHVQGRLHRSPIFRSKLLRVPLELDEPYWVEDEQFDLEYHVRHIALPKPGDWRQFCIQASRIHARALDLTRPLWEIYVVEGLDSITDLPPGSFALLTKIHHAAIDVESRNDFVELLHDPTPRPPPPEPPEPWFPERSPGAVPLLARAGLHLLVDPARLVNPLRRAAPAAAAFVRDLLRPEVHPAATRFNTIVSPHRVFDTRRFGHDEFERIRALARGATVNDAVIAVCAGGLRRYLAGHAELPRADLTAIASLDIGADRAPDASTMHIPIGTRVEDPVARLAAVHGHTLAAQDGEPPADLPPACCTITHVPGPTAPAYLHGARMTYFSAILPISDGMGLVFAVSGYGGRLVVSPTSCRELMPDPQVFTQCLRDSFQEYLALADAAPTAAAKRARPAQKPRTPGPSRASASGTPRPSGPTARTGARPLPAAPAGRRRSKAPSR